MMALYDSDLREEVFTLMELADVKNYTQFVDLKGSSQHGKKEGTVSWPGSNEIILLIMSEEQKANFCEVVSNYKKERSTPPGLLLFDWKLNEVM